jgi:hypothetical protein
MTLRLYNEVSIVYISLFPKRFIYKADFNTFFFICTWTPLRGTFSEASAGGAPRIHRRVTVTAY